MLLALTIALQIYRLLRQVLLLEQWIVLIAKPLALSVKDVVRIYKWTNATSGLENPELNLKADVNNIIQIQNPTDTKHELVIDSQGKEVATSGDIAPGASGQASFRPNGTELFSYHCEYHPDTMKGTIKLTSQ